MLTRKYFEAIAAVVAKIENPGKRQENAENHANAFEKENPRFDRKKFMKACGVK